MMTDFLYMVGGAFFILLINGIINYNKSWVGLTKEDLQEFAKETPSLEELCYAVEAKLKQKNGFAEEKNNGT
jgi:hypothetical protein